MRRESSKYKSVLEICGLHFFALSKSSFGREISCDLTVYSQFELHALEFDFKIVSLLKVLTLISNLLAFPKVQVVIILPISLDS